MYLFIYNLIFFILSPFLIFTGLIKSFYSTLYKKKFLDYVGISKTSKIASTCVHCSSLGEINGAVNLLREINKKANLIISVGTISGYKRAKELFKDNNIIFLPIDLSFIINIWLKRNNIKSLIIYETEIWPNLYKTCKNQNVKVCLVNARISKNNLHKFFYSSLVQHALNKCDFILCKSNYEKEKFDSLNILPKILNLGNLKYDYFERNKTAIKRNHYSKKIILFASLYKNEHKILFNVLNKIYRKGFITVIAPRHISQAEKIYNFLTLNDFNVGLYSETGDSFEDYEIIIIDSFGKLKNFYNLSSLTFVGGSLTKRGVQNILEPISFENPVIIGPNIENFHEEIMNLKNDNGILYGKNIVEIENYFETALNDIESFKKIGVNGKKSIESFAGVTKEYIDFLTQNNLIL